MHILCCGAEEGLFLHWRMFRNIHVLYLDFPGGSDGKDSACSVGDLGSIRSLGWEDSLEEGMVTHSGILAYKISTDRGVWQTPIPEVAKSQT